MHNIVYTKSDTNFHSDVFWHSMLAFSEISVEFRKLTELPEDGINGRRNVSE
jgi:hypothetical protein